MSRLYSHRHRPVHLGPLPTERLARAPGQHFSAVDQPTDAAPPLPEGIAPAIPEYLALLRGLMDGPVARTQAPVPAELQARSDNLKASAYFLDATLAGVCELHAGEAGSHRFALVFLIEFSREAHADEPGARWLQGCNAARTDLRCAEVAAVLAGYVRALGWQATGHVASDNRLAADPPDSAPAGLDLSVLAQRAGIAAVRNGRLQMPFTGQAFSVGAITTDYPLAPDLPIDPAAPLHWPDSAAYLGEGGTRPGFATAEAARRPLHLGRYPMERIPRVDVPTTLVLRDEIQRVPKRADLFTRALAGDLGPKAQHERTRFAVKHPLAQGMVPLIRALVPLQGTREALPPPAHPQDFSSRLQDPQHNTLAIKALAHHLGADLVGICAAEPWMYYSHDVGDAEQPGQPIEPYHPWAVVMLIDQGFETMEGASGDDWISGAQSMRAYLRGALIAGLMAAHVRRLGFSARVHSNAHSEVLHLPAVLMAGLGELSRIGELVLNPFLGPRSKSVVFTTSLPLLPDKPIDFGLQATCQMCLKCARECPCNAIPFGPKVMFNGYEIWKPDVEKCGRYRLTNMKGSACGRCMKTCPYNREDLVEAERLLWLSIETPAARRALIEHDDRTGGGERNPVKRWWFDLEMVNGVAVAPLAGVNERDLSLGRKDKLASTQKLAFFPPALQPTGTTTMLQTVPLVRSDGQAAYQAAESPQEARRRRGRPRR
jgi:reductive dehalogenase